MSKVKVVAHKGNVVNPMPNNPEYGFVRVEQSINSFEGGWMRKKTKSALISGEIDALKSGGFFDGQEMEGRIVVKESTTPTNPDNLDQDVKIAGDTGIPCMIDGQRIYRQAFYTEDASETDVLLKHDNAEQIKTAQAELSSSTKEADL